MGQSRLSHSRLARLRQNDRVTEDVAGQAAFEAPGSPLAHDVMQGRQPLPGQAGNAPRPPQERCVQSLAACREWYSGAKQSGKSYSD